MTARSRSLSARAAGAVRHPLERVTARALAVPSLALLVLLLAIALLAAAALPRAAQGQARDAGQPPLSSCTYDECGLRVDPGGVFGAPELLRGSAGHRVARFGRLGLDLPRIVAGSDSAVAHARAFRPLQRRAGIAGLLAAAAGLTAVGLDVASEANNPAPFSAAAGVLGLYAGFEAKRAARQLSRAVWWYNRAIPR